MPPGDFFDLMDDVPEDPAKAEEPKRPPPDWDPKPSERTYYRSTVDGQRGFMVRREGRDMIRYDRPNEEILRPYNEVAWQPDRAAERLSPAVMAQIAFAADRTFLLHTGRANEGRKIWLDLREDARIAWINGGPTGEARQRLYNAIMDALEPLKT